MRQWWGLAARLVTGGVWVVAGAIKLPDPATSVQRVTASGGPSSVLEAARLCSFQIKTS